MRASFSSIDALFVIAPQSLLLDIAGPAEAFRLANLHRAARGLPPKFRLRFAGTAATTVTSVGLPLARLEPLPKTLQAPTWVVVVGQPTADAHRNPATTRDVALALSRLMREHLHAQHSPHRLVTICSGTVLAARAGLLDGRQCTTHHDLIRLLRDLAPRARVVENRVFLVDGPLASSAGVTAGIDLALHLIADECGDSLAASVAEDMVVYLRRSALDPELSPFLAHRRHTHAAIHRVQDALGAAPARDWNISSLAALAHVTERHLLRLFMQHAGVSPLHYLAGIRLERARQALEHGSSVTAAAESAGFSSGLQLRRAWQRRWGGSPRDSMLNAAAPSRRAWDRLAG